MTERDETASSTDREARRQQASASRGYTPTQGRYLAFINHYTKVHGRAPAEADMAAYFRTTPPSVHQMVVNLADKGLISRTPGAARSLRLLVPDDDIPDLRTGIARTSPKRHANIDAWLGPKGCAIGLGYDAMTGTYARLIREDSVVWSGGRRSDTLDKLLIALDAAIAITMADP